jgi:propionyl-CoA synthetase
MRYAEVYEHAKTDPNTFWMEAAEGIDWFSGPSRALFDDKAPLYEWFADGKLNGC